MPSLELEKLLLKLGPIRFILISLSIFLTILELRTPHSAHEVFCVLLMTALLLNNLVNEMLNECRTMVRAMVRRPEVKSRVDFNRAMRVSYIGLSRPLGRHCTVYLPKKNQIKNYWEEYMKDDTRTFLLQPDPRWKTKYMRRQYRNKVVFFGVMAFLAIFQKAFYLMKVGNGASTALYSMFFILWGAALAYEVYHRARERGLKRKFAFVCYQMAALSALWGVLLVFKD